MLASRALFIHAGVFSCLLATGCGAKDSEMDSQLPIAGIDCVLKKESQLPFIEKLRTFSEKNRFAIRIGHPTPNPEDLTIQLSRKDLEILAVNPFVPEDFEIGAYATDKSPPATLVVVGLMHQIQASMNDVGSCKVVDLAKSL